MSETVLETGTADRPGDRRDVEVRKTILICTTPRSGSSWLKSLMASTNALGRPREYFRYQEFGRKVPTAEALRAVMSRAAAESTTPNGVFATKVFPEHFMMIERVGGFIAGLRDPRFVFLRRGDALGQAISFERALQTGQWGIRKPTNTPPSYDGKILSWRLQQIVLWNALWAHYFARTGIRPLELVYEEIARDPQAAINTIADFCGVAENVTIVPELVADAVQRDDLNRQWRERFVSEFGDRETFGFADLDLNAAVKIASRKLYRAVARLRPRGGRGLPGERE